jgi:hypothetical protein
MVTLGKILDNAMELPFEQREMFIDILQKARPACHSEEFTLLLNCVNNEESHA